MKLTHPVSLALRRRQVELTLWGEQANKYNEEELGNNAILAVKSCKVSDFGGRSLSSTFQSQIYVNMDRPEAHALRAWYDMNRDTLSNIENISKKERGEGGAGGGAQGNQRKVLSDIKDENLGMKDKVSARSNSRPTRRPLLRSFGLRVADRVLAAFSLLSSLTSSRAARRSRSSSTTGRRAAPRGTWRVRLRAATRR